MPDDALNPENAPEDFVYALAASPAFAADGICFAARASGLYASDDGGDAWRGLYDSLKLTAPLPTSAVALSPAYPFDQNLFAGVQGGILRSINGGRSWEVVILSSPPPVITALAVSPNYVRDGVVFASTVEDGVFRSADRGSHWVAWNFGLLDLNVLYLALSPDFATDQTLFAGTETGIFRSTNGGRAWREVDFPEDWAPVLSLVLSPDYGRDRLLFAGTESCGLFCSRDRGATWQRLGEDAIPGTVNAVVVSPRYSVRPDLLVLTDEGLLVSRDAGSSWSVVAPDLTAGQGLTAVVAPLGLDLGAPVLVGRADPTPSRGSSTGRLRAGGVLRIVLPATIG